MSLTSGLEVLLGTAPYVERGRVAATLAGLKEVKSWSNRVANGKRLHFQHMTCVLKCVCERGGVGGQTGVHVFCSLVSGNR